VVIFPSVRQFSKHQFNMLRLLNVLFSIKGNRRGRDGEIAKTAEKVDARRDPGYNCVQRSKTHTQPSTAQLLYCNKLPHTNKYVATLFQRWLKRADCRVVWSPTQSDGFAAVLGLTGANHLMRKGRKNRENLFPDWREYPQDEEKRITRN
jgi:hypothetical protein